MAWPTPTNSRTTTTTWRNTRQKAKTQLPQHCNHCHTTTTPLELDHITPIAEGGTDHPTNLQWLCTTCHKHKTQQEATRGQQRRHNRRHLPTPPHPGLTQPQPPTTPPPGGGPQPPTTNSPGRHWVFE